MAAAMVASTSVHTRAHTLLHPDRSFAGYLARCSVMRLPYIPRLQPPSPLLLTHTQSVEDLHDLPDAHTQSHTLIYMAGLLLDTWHALVSCDTPLLSLSLSLSLSHTHMHTQSVEDLHDLDLRVSVDVAAMAAAASSSLSKGDVSLLK